MSTAEHTRPCGRYKADAVRGATILARVVWVAQHAVLGLAALAMGAAALRAASLTGAVGLQRIVAAAPLAAAAACAESVVLGVVRLGSSPVALGLAALVTWAASLSLPARGPAVGAELSAWWAARSRGERAVTGAAAGAFLALCAWLLKYPYVGNDGVTYHLNTVVDFVESGRPTDLVTSTYAFPTANHPLTNELLLSWPISIARSFVPATLWTPVALLLAGLAAWVGLRSLAVPPRVRALAVAALCTLPLNLEHLGEPNSDTPALTWLLCAAALAAGAGRRPALLVPAVVAGGMALGTKTTVLWPLLVALGLGAYLARGRLRELRLPLWPAFAVALVVGGYWYARNTVDHGFPLWPFIATPWSDPLPRLLELFSHTFLDRPRVTLEGRVDDYVETLAGALVLIPAAVLLPLVARRRAVTAAAGVTVVSLFLWANAPITGLGDVIGLEDFSVSALRYLLPAMTVVVFTVALAARAGDLPARLAAVVLGVAVAWNLIVAAGLGFPFLPGLGTLLVGAAVGVLAAAFIGRRGRGRGGRRERRAGDGTAAVSERVPRGGGTLVPRLAAVVSAALAGALLAAPASGWVQRHGAVARTQDAELVRWFAATGRLDDTEPLAFTRIRYAPLAGDRLKRSLDLVPEREPCARARSRGWVVFGAEFTLPVRGRPKERFPEIAPVERCRFKDRPAYKSALFRVYEPRGSGL